MEPYDEQKSAAERSAAECGSVSEQNRGRTRSNTSVRHMGGRAEAGPRSPFGQGCGTSQPPSAQVALDRSWIRSQGQEAQNSGEILAGVSDRCGLPVPVSSRCIERCSRQQDVIPAPEVFM